MEKYKEYMDRVQVSDTLHRRLVELDAPKRPVMWKRYGAVAAALVLAVGLSTWGLSKVPARDDYAPLISRFTPETDIAPMPDIAYVSPGEMDQPGEKTLGGYEVQLDDGTAAYNILPYIEYGTVDGVMNQADWDIPVGASRRDLTQNEIAALMGGEDAVDIHLDWGGYELTGWAAWYEDGSFWGAYIYGYAGPLDHFEFAVTAEQLPPTCFGYPTSVTQEVWGLTVTADKYDGQYGCDRRVSFMKDGYGFHFGLTATDAERAEPLVSRMVRWIAEKGLALYAVTQEEPIPDFVPDYDPTYEDGIPAVSTDPEICVLPPYDPAGAADSAYHAPGEGTDAFGTGSLSDGAGHSTAIIYD